MTTVGAPRTVNPHPPLADDEIVDCAGCGHPVSVDDDLMAWENGAFIAHVDCA